MNNNNDEIRFLVISITYANPKSKNLLILSKFWYFIALFLITTLTYNILNNKMLMILLKVKQIA